MNKYIRNIIEECCNKRNFSYEHIVSGAGHDSLPIGRVIDTGMIFVPSKGGRSHCKDEFTDYEYLMQAVIIATDVICNTD